MDKIPRRILTIDIGKACGWAKAVKGIPVAWGTAGIVEQGRKTLLQVWRDWLEVTIDQFNPDYIVYEKPFVSRNAASVLLMQREGVLLMIASDYGVDIQGVAVSTLKKVVTDNGRADKDAMVAEINLLFGIDVATDHEADALACLVWAIKNLTKLPGRIRKFKGRSK